MACQNDKITKTAISLMRSGLLAGLSDPFMSQNLIRWDAFSFVHIPFGGMVESQSFALIPVDSLSHLVVTGIVFLSQFANFAYYVVKLFVSFST